MATSTTLLSMAHDRKFENLRAFMVNLANSRGVPLPETILFEQKFLDLCLSPTPDHPTYSAMIFMAITELNEEGGSCENAISEFIKSKYKNLPFAHTNLLSHHLGKLVEKTEVLYDYNNYCYSLPGEKDKTDAPTATDAERKSLVIRVRTNDNHAANEDMLPNEEESTRMLMTGNHKVNLLEEQSLIECETIPIRKACGDINVVEVRYTEDNGVKACLRDSTVEDNRVAEEPEVALGISESEGRIETNREGGELYEVVVLDAQDDVSGKEKEIVMGIFSRQRKAKLRSTSNTMKDACVEVNNKAYKRLWECQTEACDSIIALEKMLKQCREKDLQNKALSEVDDISHLPLSVESCKELWKVAHKIQSQLSEIIDSCDEAEVPYYESQGCGNKNINNRFLKEGSKKRKAHCGRNGSEKTSKKRKRKETDSQKKSQLNKIRIKKLRDI